MRVYTGTDGTFSLYEDENTNNNYLKGKSSSIPFDWNEATATLTIGARKGAFDGMLTERTFNVVFVDTNNGHGDLESKTIDRSVKYSGQAITFKK